MLKRVSERVSMGYESLIGGFIVYRIGASEGEASILGHATLRAEFQIYSDDTY